MGTLLFFTMAARGNQGGELVKNAELLALQRLDEKSVKLQQSGRYMEALECMERGLVLRQHFFGTDSDEVWQSCKTVGELCNLLAMTYLQQVRISPQENPPSTPLYIFATTVDEKRKSRHSAYYESHIRVVIRVLLLHSVTFVSLYVKTCDVQCTACFFWCGFELRTTPGRL